MMTAFLNLTLFIIILCRSALVISLKNIQKKKLRNKLVFCLLFMRQ